MKPSTTAAQSAPVGRALVVGASSGIGAALVERLAREGWHVAALARRAEELEALRARCAGHPGRVLVCVHDAREFDRVPALFEELVRELGGLELVVYAAALMPKVGRDEYDTRKDIEQLAVNLGGCIAWCNESARLFRSQRAGTIVGISSIAGERGRKGNPVYATTKAGMNTYLEALRNRLAESNVHVCTIKPGFVDTAMTRDLGKQLLWLISAEEAARLVLKAARARANERFVPRRWWLVAKVIRCIPSFLFRHLNV